MMADLKGKAGIVTGGSSGIGFQIANVLAIQNHLADSGVDGLCWCCYWSAMLPAG